MSTTAGSTGFPEEIWLGIKRGEWPVEAFPNEDMARRWAAEGGTASSTGRIRYVVGPLPIPRDLPARRARIVPEKAEWKES